MTKVKHKGPLLDRVDQGGIVKWRVNLMSDYFPVLDSLSNTIKSQINVVFSTSVPVRACRL